MNKALKMAKKSAMIDATLQMGGLSELFTLDLEDLTHTEVKESGQKQSPPTGSGTSVEMASEKQIEFIKNMAKSHLLTADEKSQIDAAVNKGMPKQKANLLSTCGIK